MASSSTLRHINQARVLDALRQRRVASRVELATHLGLQRSTITVIISALLEQGLVHEVDEDSAEGARSVGRPAVGLALSGSSAYFAGIDLGNEESTAIVLDLTGAEVGRASAPTVSSGPEVAERALIALLGEALQGRPDVRARLQGIGVTVSGMVADGVISWAPVLGWRDVRFGQLLEEAFRVQVILGNDANAAVLSELQFGEALGYRDVVYVLLDRGTGVGVVLDRTLHPGAGGRVGESGHIRMPAFGTPQTRWPRIQDLIGTSGLRRSYAELGGTATDLAGLLADLDAGAPAAVSAVEAWEERLAWFTSILVWTLGPELVVFGGRESAMIARRGFDGIHDHLDEALEAPELVVSQFGSDAIVMGAASLPMSEFFAMPALRPEEVPGETRQRVDQTGDGETPAGALRAM